MIHVSNRLRDVAVMTAISSYQQEGSAETAGLLNQDDDEKNKGNDEREPPRRHLFCLVGMAVCLGITVAVVTATNRIALTSTFQSHGPPFLVGNSNVNEPIRCNSFFGKVYNQKAISGIAAAQRDSDIMTSNDVTDVTFLSIPQVDNPAVADYFILHPFHGGSYLEYGTISILDGKDTTCSSTSNCHVRFYMNDWAIDHWVTDSQLAMYNTWDVGTHWIVTGSWKSGSNLVAQWTMVEFPIKEKKECRHRVKKLMAAFGEKGITVPETAKELCL